MAKNIPTGNDPLQRWIQAQSTHEALANRQLVYQKLGLNKPGFWVDLKQRTLQQNQPADDMPSSAQQPVDYNDPYDDTALNYTVDPAPKLNPVNTLKMPLIPGQGQSPGGKANLPEFEKGAAWSQLRESIRKNPIIGTDGSDLSIADKNYMNANVVMQMNADPTKFLSQAMIEYYNEKRQTDLTDWANNTTNFEKMTAMSSTIKKRNKKVTGRFIGPTESQKNAASQSYVQQTKGGGPTKQMNVKMGGYYSSPLYVSPFGN